MSGVAYEPDDVLGVFEDAASEEQIFVCEFDFLVEGEKVESAFELVKIGVGFYAYDSAFVEFVEFFLVFVVDELCFFDGAFGFEVLFSVKGGCFEVDEPVVGAGDQGDDIGRELLVLFEFQEVAGSQILPFYFLFVSSHVDFDAFVGVTFLVIFVSFPVFVAFAEDGETDDEHEGDDGGDWGEGGDDRDALEEGGD